MRSLLRRLHGCVSSKESDITGTPNNKTTSAVFSGSQMRSTRWWACGSSRETRKHADSTNVALGVDADFSTAVSGRRVIFKPTSGRTEFILNTLQRAKKDNYLAPRVAATFLGKLYFLLISGAHFGCGRAATQPLVQRASQFSASRAGKVSFLLQARWS